MEIDTTILHNGIKYPAEITTIKETKLGFGDRAFFTFSLDLRGNGWGQHFGNSILDTPKAGSTNFEREGTAWGLDLIGKILKTVGVDYWEQLKGRRVYLIQDPDLKHSHPCIGIAGVLNDEILILADNFKAWKDSHELTNGN